MENVNVEYLRENCFDQYNDGVDGQIVHDDGFMHIGVGNVRYSFDVGQEVSSSEYNRQCNRILRESGISHVVSGRNN